MPKVQNCKLEFPGVAAPQLPFRKCNLQNSKPLPVTTCLAKTVEMGSAIGSFRKIDFAAGTGVDDHGEEKKIDDRRRNSLAFYISEFVLYDNDKENDNYKALIDLVKNERKAKHASVRPSKFSKLADTILHGNMKELRNQVIVHWPNINRKYKDHHFDNSLLHMACQEGYYAMLLFMGDKHNHSEFDDAVLDFTAKNMRDRTPLFLCFTPPTATYCGLNFGLDNEGNSLSEKPDDIEKLSDWIKPGGPRSRENCIRYLIDKGANVNEADYHDFTCLHYATMWGWPSTVKLLLDSNADINAVNIGGKTALMMAVEYEHDDVLTVLSKHKTVQLDIADSEGYTALLRAAEKKDSEVAVSLMKILLEAGADPNAATIRRKTALKMACQQQDMVKVHLLFDYKVTRRNSAIDLLADKFQDEVVARMKEEEKKRIQMEKLAKAAEEAALNSYVLDGNKDPRGKWLEFRDKESKSGQPFYYNTVTRKCTKEKPRDFKPDNTRLVPDAIYGLNFYH
eukprot:gene30701-39985_t